MNIEVKQITGINKTVCEDFIYTTEPEPDYFFAGVADGQSNKQYCIEGGKTALTIIADYMQKQDLASFSNRYLDEVQYELIHTIRQQLDFLARIRETDAKDFSSTICSIAANPMDGNFVLTHLGDGCIVGLTTDNHLRILSAPENGITRYHTYLTTSPSALTHVRLSQGKLQNYRAIYIMTDGASCISREGSIERKARSLLLQRDFDRLSYYMEESKPRDDSSLIMIAL